MKYYKTSNSIVFNKNDKYVVLTKTKNGVRITNISDEDIDWITVRGNHIPVKKGQSKADAIRYFIESKKSGTGLDKESSKKEVKKFVVIHTGGSIGERESIIESYDDVEKAKEKAKRMQKLLSPGQRKYYKESYQVIQRDNPGKYHYLFEEGSEGSSDKGNLRKDLMEVDGLASEINKEASYEDVVKKPWEIYDILGVGDSALREHAFIAVADKYGLEYEDLYQAWLGNSWEEAVNKIRKEYGDERANKLKEKLSKI